MKKIDILDDMIEEVKTIISSDDVKAYSLGKKYGISETQMKKYKNSIDSVENMRISNFRKFFKS